MKEFSVYSQTALNIFAASIFSDDNGCGDAAVLQIFVQMGGFSMEFNSDYVVGIRPDIISPRETRSWTH